MTSRPAECHIQFRPIPNSADSQRRYQVSAAYGGLLAFGGATHASSKLNAQRLVEVRRAYNQFLNEKGTVAAGLSFDYAAALKLGRQVASLLPTTVQRTLLQAVVAAQRERRLLRVVLMVHPQVLELLSVPWELLVLPPTTLEQQLVASLQAIAPSPFATEAADAADSNAPAGSTPIPPPLLDGDMFVFRTSAISLVRSVNGIGIREEGDISAATLPQIIAASPAPGTLAYGPIDLATRQERLKEVLGLDRSHWYTGPATLAALATRLPQQRPAILHLICHGVFSELEGSVLERSDLIFLDATGRIERMNVFDIAPVLSLSRPELKVVIVEACHGANQDLPAQPRNSPIPDLGEPPDPAHDARLAEQLKALESLALGLVRHQVPWVIGFQGAVPSLAAAEFSAAFYAALRRGLSVDAAVAAGRVVMNVPDALDWTLPVVYSGAEQTTGPSLFARSADWVEKILHRESIRQRVRSWLLGSGLALLMAALAFGLLLGDVDAPPNLGQYERWAWFWLGNGLIGPAVIATSQRGLKQSADPALIALGRKALIQQWTGAYMGFALGGILGVLVLALLLIAGGLAWLPPGAVLALLVAACACGHVWSYAVARIMVKQTTYFGVGWPELTNVSTALVMALVPVVLLPVGAAVLAIGIPTVVESTAGIVISLVIVAVLLLTTAMFPD